jgi:hypothetical protein
MVRSDRGRLRDHRQTSPVLSRRGRAPSARDVASDAITDPDPAAAKCAFDEMMRMRTIDIATIEAARRGTATPSTK